MAPDTESKTAPRIGTGWLIVAVVVAAVATTILVVYAAYTNQRDDNPSGNGQMTAQPLVRGS